MNASWKLAFRLTGVILLACVLSMLMKEYGL